ncbi:Sec-independent protein translocase, TatC subunit [Solidesulfovibrio fructosivorans JJ]]|uniref:Sec-independent protein translocase protein TatC n=1 Tax=Solidesulfovibrio fructosivorans JJ] TaxID=596151 RepID=E1JX33_SOLFR|nr:twin-arginine translocase subunit TatC [Solidesulfovibrio fructosivorans]EFL50998.1 Sec-independent protein translocase, TatC subunit [Solidesulfovibrio fructosivorans JJ]]
MTDTPEKDAIDNTPATTGDAASTAETSPAAPETDASGGNTPPPPADPPAPVGDAAAPPATTPPPSPGKHGDMKEAPLLEHLVELRTRLVRCLIAVGVGFAACYAFAEKLLEILLHPLMQVMPGGSKLIATSLPETFFTVMKLALVAGAFVASPYIFYQLWKFVAPGLYKEERKIIIPVAVATAVFFVGGALFGYFVVFPFGFKFFVDYASDYITVMPTISAYFSLAVTLLFAFGIIFELPVFIFFLTSLGLVTTKTLRKFRRWAILLSFVVAAILTPTPDAVNQLLMAGPMVVLYELGIWVSWFVDKSRKEEKARKQAEAEAAKNPDAAKTDQADAAEANPQAAEGKEPTGEKTSTEGDADRTAAATEKPAGPDDDPQAG